MNEAQSALLLGIALGFLIRAVRERFGSAIRLVEGMRKQLESLLSEIEHAIVLWPGGEIKLRDDNGSVVAKLVNTGGKALWIKCDDKEA